MPKHKHHEPRESNVEREVKYVLNHQKIQRDAVAAKKTTENPTFFQQPTTETTPVVQQAQSQAPLPQQDNNSFVNISDAEVSQAVATQLLNRNTLFAQTAPQQQPGFIASVTSTIAAPFKWLFGGPAK